MDFIALDFETATNEADSPCEMGLALVRGGVVREVRNWLIKPRQWPFFSPFTMAVHGIRPEDVAHSPGFAEVWEEAMPLMQGHTIVAHNAAFDLHVLRSTLIRDRLPLPTFSYFCSVSLCRRVWPGHRSYGLGSMCAVHGIGFKHHRAGHDAAAAAQLVLLAGVAAGASTVDGLLKRSRLKCGGLNPQEHRTPGGKVTMLG
ncbi:MAG: 3'-5' exonuclease [Flavobacteriales bacterium]|nr:3'-5' exonuclease [Flavobacteriales bacterium]MBP9080635.1 3'-5' exonuclease [Flavobacteriales bacterium]